MIVEWIAFVLVGAVSAQYYGHYYGRYGCPPPTAGYLSPFGWGSPTYGMAADPYHAANPYAMSGAIADPAVSGLCVDTNIQCPIWAATGQCATNAIIMRRMCARSCGTCALGNVPGLGIGPGIGPGYGYGAGMGLGYGELGMNPITTPLLGKNIYEQGMLRSPTKSTIYPKSVKKNKLLPSNIYSPMTD